MPLTNQQTKHLKRLAHHLNPVVIVGQHGLTEGVLNEVAASLEAHELIKVKVNAADREEREAMLAAIAASTSAELVQRIGHVAVFYRANPSDPRISLPKR